MIASRAPIACAAIATPCSTLARARVMSVRESGLFGSASYALATRSGSRPSFVAATTARSLSARGYPAPPRPRRPDAATAAMRSSCDRTRAFATPAFPRPSKWVAAVLAGKGRLENVLDLVLVKRVVRRRRRCRRPGARDGDVAGEPAPAARDRGPLARRCAAEVREERSRGVHVGHRLPELVRDALRRGPRQIAVFRVGPIEHARHAVEAGRLSGDDPVDAIEGEAVLVLRGHGDDGRRHRTARAVRRGLHHADAVVGGARREQRPFAEPAPEFVRDRDRARRTGLLAHETGLALEDAGLGLEQQRDEPARALGELALLVWVVARDQTRPHEVLQRAQHAAEDPEHYRSRSISPRREMCSRLVVLDPRG